MINVYLLLYENNFLQHFLKLTKYVYSLLKYIHIYIRVYYQIQHGFI